MDKHVTTSKTFIDLLKQESPLQITGVINALTAKIAVKQGFKALYLSGAGVATTRGLPDLGLTSLNDVLCDIRQITEATACPLLVDVDTGWGSPLNIERTFKLVATAGAKGAHIEDQASFKRCGHRAGKKVVSTQAMCQRIQSAKIGLSSFSEFMLMARTDALQSESLDETIERVMAYESAGADAIFLEAVTDLAQYQSVEQALNIPILANMTEFGQTPLATLDELRQHGVSFALYPLSAFRAMNAAAEAVFKAIRQNGSQNSVIDKMQTRDELYQILNYHEFENKLNQYLSDKENGDDE